MMQRYRVLSAGLASLLRVLLCCLAATAPALAQAPGAAPSVGTVLSPDGTLRTGAQGSFDATGYQLSYGKGGQPVLRPAAVSWNALGNGAAGQQNGVSDPVLAVAVSGTDVYIGGNFTQAGGIAANHVARWDGTAWHPLGAGVNDIVFALAVSGSTVYVGGGFDQAGGASANYVAAWDGTAWSPLGTGPANGADAPVNALALSGNTLYAGGYFAHVDNLAASYVARWDPSTATWSPLGAGVNDAVFALAVSGPDLYVGGSFDQAGGASANYVARWDGTAWSPLGMGTGTSPGGASASTGTVLALAVSGTAIYAGGQFTTAGGAAANYVARWDAGTATWSPLGTGTANGVDQAVNALAVSGSSVYVGGQLTQAGGAPASYAARWDGATWSALGASTAANGLSDVVYTLAASSFGVYVGGQFGQASGLATNYVAAWDGTTWSSLGTDAANGVSDPAQAALVQAVAIAGQDVYVGGQFTTAGTIAANNVARWNGSAWSALGTGSANGVNYPVRALAVSGSNVYVGGFFTQAGGVAASNVARWDGSAWHPLGTGTANGVNSYVYALAASGSTVYVGGQFTQAGGTTVAANYVARWDGVAWSALGTGSANGVNKPVVALAVSGANVYVGGFFDYAGGAAASNVARWNGDSWSALGVGTDGPVLALAASGSSLYVGGSFDYAGGAAVSNVARWDGAAWSALGTSPNDGANSTVNALAVRGTTLYAGGGFDQAGGVAANYVAQWDGTTWTSVGTGSGTANGLSSTAYALALGAAGVYSGGDFTQAGGLDANRVAYYFVASTATPLPVQLVAFTAQPQGAAAVRLAWATASEAASARFEAERSPDGVTFAKIGTVAAAGTSSVAHTYGLTDAALPTSTTVLYYRLRQVDLDGSFSYSPVRSVALADGGALSLYPNPTTGAATYSGLAAGTPVQVFDALGRVAATATADAGGAAHLPAGLPPGVYVVRSGSHAQRLVVE